MRVWLRWASLPGIPFRFWFMDWGLLWFWLCRTIAATVVISVAADIVALTYCWWRRVSRICICDHIQVTLCVLMAVMVCGFACVSLVIHAFIIVNIMLCMGGWRLYMLSYFPCVSWAPPAEWLNRNYTSHCIYGVLSSLLLTPGSLCLLSGRSNSCGFYYINVLWWLVNMTSFPLCCRVIGARSDVTAVLFLVEHSWISC